MSRGLAQGAVTIKERVLNYHLRTRNFTQYSVNSSTTARIANQQQPTTNLSGHCQQQCPSFLRTNRPELLRFGRSYTIRISKHSRQKLKGPNLKLTATFIVI